MKLCTFHSLFFTFRLALFTFLFPLCILHSVLAMAQEITVQELKTKRDTGAPIILLDVREPEEVAYVRLPGSIHIPMGDIPGRLHELDPEKEIIVYCHHGVRSLHVAQFLVQRDFEQVASLAGGIEAWAVEIEPGMPRY
jgi:adenylyltransferase/sulfurtransferase